MVAALELRAARRFAGKTMHLELRAGSALMMDDNVSVEEIGLFGKKVTCKATEVQG